MGEAFRRCWSSSRRASRGGGPPSGSIPKPRIRRQESSITGRSGAGGGRPSSDASWARRSRSACSRASAPEGSAVSSEEKVIGFSGRGSRCSVPGGSPYLLLSGVAVAIGHGVHKSAASPMPGHTERPDRLVSSVIARPPFRFLSGLCPDQEPGVVACPLPEKGFEDREAGLTEGVSCRSWGRLPDRGTSPVRNGSTATHENGRMRPPMVISHRCPLFVPPQSRRDRWGFGRTSGTCVDPRERR